MVAFCPKINVPPNHSTATIRMVPKNSLIGCAIAWRIATLFVASRSSLLHLVKRLIILSSAIKALMMRKPPSVSSNCDIVSLHFACASSDWRFSFLPTTPINQPIPGNTIIVKRVNCQLTVTNVTKYIIIRIGLFINISKELVMEFSTSPTSPLIRAMISPFLSSEKKDIGRRITLAYTIIRISRTTPVRNGIITAEEAK